MRFPWRVWGHIIMKLEVYAWKAMSTTSMSTSWHCNVWGGGEGGGGGVCVRM
jgi:hypothetical protein